MSDNKHVLEAIVRFVERQVQLNLPENLRGLRARRALQPILREGVIDALNGLVERLAAQVVRDLEIPAEELPSAETITARMGVLHNEQPCSKCGTVRELAIIVLEEGRVTGVECDQCAPELKEK